MTGVYFSVDHCTSSTDPASNLHRVGPRLEGVRESNCGFEDTITGRDGAMVDHLGVRPVVFRLARISPWATGVPLSASHFLTRLQLLTLRMRALPAYTAFRVRRTRFALGKVTAEEWPLVILQHENVES
jgi:hypothetical protein